MTPFDLEECGDKELQSLLKMAKDRVKTLKVLKECGVDPKKIESRMTHGLPTVLEIMNEIGIREVLHKQAIQYPVGEKIIVTDKIRGFNTACAAEPPLMTRGVVTDKSSQDRKLSADEIPADHAAVRFLATDLGYVKDSERPYVVYFIPWYAIEAA